MFKVIKIGLLLCLFSLSGCVTVRQPIVTGISNFQLSPSGQDLNLKFDVLLKNPNNFGLTLQKLDMYAFFGDSLVSEIDLDDKMRIKANSETSIPFSLMPKVSLLPQLAVGGISQLFKKGSNTYKVKGELIVRKFVLRKKYSFKYP